MSPKNLGKTDIGDLLDDLEIPMLANALWGGVGEKSSRRSFTTEKAVSRSRSSSIACHLELSRTTLDMDSIVNQVRCGQCKYIIYIYHILFRYTIVFGIRTFR